MYSLLLAIALTAASPQFEVRTLDGRTLTGPVASLDAEQVTVQTPGGLVSLDIENLMAILPKEKPAPPDGEPTLRIDLVDGSSLLAGEYSVDDGRARIVLSDGHAIDAPASSVASVRILEQSEDLDSEWARIRGIEVDTDLLVIRKGESIDYYRGVLRDVTAEVVQFELDGSVLPVKRAKVFGLVYYRPPSGTLPKSVCRLTDAGGSQWSVHSLAMSADLKWTTCSGLQLTRPAAAVAQIDFSHGKVVFLSDLKPESVVFTPCIGTNKDVPALAKFYVPREDENLESGPLQLNKTTYSKGLALHSRTEVVYRLPDRFRRFKAIVGIDDGVRPHGNVRLVISGDGQVLRETTVAGTDPPESIDLDLTGVRRLAVLVDFGENLDVADHLNLCEARVTK